MQVIADTSFLMIPGMFGVDIIRELERLLGCQLELLIPSTVLAELERISKHGKPKERMATRLGLLIAKRGKVVEIEGDTDESIVELAVAKKCFVGTLDSGLRKTLRKHGINVVYLVGKSHLGVNGQIK